MCCSASGYVYCTRCSTCAPFSTSLSMERVEKRFSSRMRELPIAPHPRGVCFLCVHLPVINDCSASLTDTATTTTTPEKQTEKRKDLKENEGQKVGTVPYCISELELIALANRWVDMSEREGKQKEGLQG